MKLKLLEVRTTRTVTVTERWEPRMMLCREEDGVRVSDRDMTPEDLAQLTSRLDGEQRTACLAEWHRIANTMPKDKQWAFDGELDEMLSKAERRADVAEERLRHIRTLFASAMQSASTHCRSDPAEYANGAGSARACFYQVEQALVEP